MKYEIEDGNWANYQRFYNEWLGQPWDAEAQGLSAERISTATYDLVDRRDTNRGLLDERVLLVVSGTDVQMDRIETEVIGLGYDLPTRRPLTFGLEYMVVGGGAADSINDPELWDEWERWITGVAWTHPLAPDASVWVQRGLVDSGYMPEIVQTRLRREAWMPTDPPARSRREWAPWTRGRMRVGGALTRSGGTQGSMESCAHGPFEVEIF